MIRRREFITLLGVAAACPLAVRAQRPDQVKRIAWLDARGEQDAIRQTSRRAFDEEMAKLGWTEERNLHISIRAAAGDDRRLRANAAELIAEAPDVILVNGTQATAILQQKTRTIPIVFVNVADAVASGFVASMAHPAGNITGFTSVEYSLAGKWLNILKDIAPSTTRVMVLYYPGNANWTGYLPTIQSGARSLGVNLSATPVNTPKETAQRIEAFAAEPGGGMIVLPSGLTIANREEITALCLQRRLPAVYAYSFFASSGGLASYGSDTVDLYRRAAAYVDRILRGEKPGELPVQAPTKFELIINLKTAKAMGLTVPPTLRALADEVIE
ncbi:MAG TPA: ABC transporter substrate-binding protein [Xanthobacteraceae bacterium]|jgi:putative ABC transport system substrate-binding protein